MTANAIGHDAPCPCGSGKPFQHCCLGQPSGPDSLTAATRASRQVVEELRAQLQNQSFQSIEDAQAFLDMQVQAINHRPEDDFAGLSAAEMHALLNQPYQSPGIVQLATKLANSPETKITQLFGWLVSGIGPAGIKATATGNLPRQLCRDIALAYLGEERYQEHTRYGNINSEIDFFDLHTTRVVAVLGGLITIRKGKFLVSQKCRKLLANDDMSAIYPVLLEAYTTKFNWAYYDRYPEAPIIQHAAFFSLYLLARYGAAWRPATFYEDAFLQAFPMALNQFQEGPPGSEEPLLRSCYTSRTLLHFATLFGMIATKETSAGLWSRQYQVKALPLLQEAMQFRGAA